MDDKTYEINFKCIFCGYDKFEIPHEKAFLKEEEQIKCPNCGNTNDYFLLRQIAIQEGQEKIKDYVNREIKKMFKKLK